MKTISIVFAFSLVFAAACSNDRPADTASNEVSQPAAVTAASSDLTPEQLGALGADISKSPGEADRLLAKHGMDQQKFEQAVRKVSEDPAASKRYADAYRKARA